MFPYLTFLLATVASALPEDESWPAGYPPTPPLLDGATAPDVVNIMFQGAGLLKDTEIVASIIGVVSQSMLPPLGRIMGDGSKKTNRL